MVVYDIRGRRLQIYNSDGKDRKWVVFGFE